MRATGAEGGGAGDEIVGHLRQYFELWFAGTAENLQLRAQPAIAHFGGDGFGGFEERNENLRQDGGV